MIDWYSLPLHFKPKQMASSYTSASPRQGEDFDDNDSFDLDDDQDYYEQGSDEGTAQVREVFIL